MKKLLLLFIIATTISSCRITKSLTMWSAKRNSNLTELAFIQAKKSQLEKETVVLNSNQFEKASEIWKEERSEMKNINQDAYDQIAPVIYKSEIKFRKLLNTEQLVLHKAHKYENDDREIKEFFLSDYQMAEIKRIYKLKYE